MNEQTEKVITRMAPSPTGHLHIGTARAALFNYLYAHHNKGTFVLRSEDTDRARSSLEYEKEIRDGLSWLGIEADAFYRQSERTHIYEQYLKQIVDSDHAYVSKEESKNEPGKEVEVVRLKNPNKTISFEDHIRGTITFDTTELGDFVIARSMNDALYHFTVVVDDHDMHITHVIRGEDHISNTPRQILIQEALGLHRPQYAHLPLILAPDKSKMSKRHGAVSLNTYKEEGFLPEALVNYFALLGWSPGNDQEIFSLDELVQLFSLEGVQKGGAVFDREKLMWFNKQHLDTYSDSAFLALISKAIPPKTRQLPQYTAERFTKLLPTIRERTRIVSDVLNDIEAGEYDFAFTTPALDLSMLAWKKDSGPKDALPRLKKILEIIESLDEENSPETIKNALWPYAEEEGRGEVLWPLRVALTGREKSPDPFMVSHILGISEAKKRIVTACEQLSSE